MIHFSHFFFILKLSSCSTCPGRGWSSFGMKAWNFHQLLREQAEVFQTGPGSASGSPSNWMCSGCDWRCLSASATLAPVMWQPASRSCISPSCLEYMCVGLRSPSKYSFHRQLYTRWRSAAPVPPWTVCTSFPSRDLSNGRFRFHTPVTPNRWWKLCQRRVLKTILTRSSVRRSQQNLTIQLFLPGLPDILPFHLIRLDTRSQSVSKSAPSSPQCPKHMDADQLTPPKSRSLTFVLRCPGAKWTYGCPDVPMWFLLWTNCD